MPFDQSRAGIECFRLAQTAKARLPCQRIMQLYKIGVFLSGVALIFCCSCEKHQLGELPAVQKEHVDLANGSEANSDVVKERPASPESSVAPTPVEFFPEATPR